MPGERSLEGWAPDVGDPAERARVIDLAFDYRGDVTVVRTDGVEVAGYVYNRDADVPEPFVEMFDSGGGPLRLRYAEIRTIRFTGKDTAAGRSYEAWLERKTARTDGGTGSSGPR